MSENPSLRQKRLAALFKSTSGMIRADDVIGALHVDRKHASNLLAGWHRQGMIRRVAQGLYVPIEPTAIDRVQVLENPWVLVDQLYQPGYIGGWTALEYWDLTEQMFRSVCVLTNKRTTYGNKLHQGVNFFIKHIPQKQLFGTKSLWQNHIKIQISDPYKTMLDVIDDFYLGAGSQHTIDCLSAFSRRYNKKSDLDQLLEYAIQINNGALFKKLGFLAEMLQFNPYFINECHKHITKGYSYFDRRSEENSLITRWNLWIPKGTKVND